MKKIIIFVILLSMLAVLFGCDVKDDSTLAGAMIIDESSATPSNQPSIPDSFYDTSYSSDGGGGGIADFEYSGSSTSGSLLPDANKGKATANVSSVTIWEGKNPPSSDEYLEKAIEKAKNQLSIDYNFNKFAFLIVSAEEKLSSSVTLHLNTTYTNKKAYKFYINSKGEFVRTEKTNPKDYISVIVDESRQLLLNFPNGKGTFIIVFGEKQ